MFFPPLEFPLPNLLQVDDNFTPYPSVVGDEFYPNGIFHFNITRMLEYIREHPDDFTPKEVVVKDFPKGFSCIDESHMDSVEISRPVILAEISPQQYNLIDGNHRIEKARRLGLNSIQAYKFKVDQHIMILDNKEAYKTYVGFWNDKVKNMLKHQTSFLHLAPSKCPIQVEVPAMNFLMIDGEGDPNGSQGFQEAIEALFSLSYTLKFMVKKGPHAFDFGVMPLKWKTIIRQPISFD